MNNEQYIKSFQDYFRYLNRSEATITTYTNNVMYFLTSIGKNVEEITKRDVTSYMLSLSDKSSSTKNVALRSINSFYNVLIYDLELLDMAISPAYKVRAPKIVNKTKVPLTKEDIHRLLKASKNTRDRAIIELFANTGLRVNELIMLTLKQYRDRTNDNMITLVVTKGSKERELYLNDDAINAIDSYVKLRGDFEGSLFISNYGNKMDASGIRKTLKTIARRAGFDEEQSTHICCHLFRTSYATNLADEGVPIQTIQSILGHTSIETTRRYVKTSAKQVKEAMIQY